jgi:hypothetical protein
LESSREQHFTVVLLANAHPNACVLALLFLSFLPYITHMSAIANQKFNHLCLQGYQPTTMPQESEYLAPYSTPCQQEVAKRTTLHPNSQSSAPTLIIIKEKRGE